MHHRESFVRYLSMIGKYSTVLSKGILISAISIDSRCKVWLMGPSFSNSKIIYDICIFSRAVGIQSFHPFLITVFHIDISVFQTQCI